MVFAASLLGAQHGRDSLENKPAGSLLSLGKTLNWMPLYVAYRWRGHAVYSLWCPSLTEDLQIELMSSFSKNKDLFHSNRKIASISVLSVQVIHGFPNIKYTLNVHFL